MRVAGGIPLGTRNAKGSQVGDGLGAWKCRPPHAPRDVPMWQAEAPSPQEPGAPPALGGSCSPAPSSIQNNKIKTRAREGVAGRRHGCLRARSLTPTHTLASTSV